MVLYLFVHVNLMGLYLFVRPCTIVHRLIYLSPIVHVSFTSRPFSILLASQVLVQLCRYITLYVWLHCFSSSCTIMHIYYLVHVSCTKNIFHLYSVIVPLVQSIIFVHRFMKPCIQFQRQFWICTANFNDNCSSTWIWILYIELI